LVLNFLLFLSEIILVIMFFLSAIFKFGHAKFMVQHWNEYRYPIWFMHVIALLELSACLGMIVSFWIPELTKIFAALLALLMIGAIHAHFFRARHAPHMAINAVVMFILSVAIFGFGYL
jgi:DoxX-like family